MIAFTEAIQANPSAGIADATAQGATQRRVMPRRAHGQFTPAVTRADPVQILIDQGAGRIQHLLPVRYGRMSIDPFAFFRGAAAIMAADLAAAPSTGLRVQASGDAHLANFGAYATPEGIPVFDLNDFDETLPAPFEWDVKRLATSLILAGQVASMPDGACRKLAASAVRRYRSHIAGLAKQSPLDAWSTRIDLAGAIADIDPPKLRRQLERRLGRVLDSGLAHFDLIETRDGAPRIREKPPLVVRLDDHELPARTAFASYAATLQEDRRILLSRYTLRDVAFKVVGVGSVGTFCAIGLLTAADGSPLLLQIKQAQTSVLAPYAGASAYGNQGERVVVGQRMLQAATEVFLGWTAQPIDGRDFYVRRLKDSRLADIGAAIEGSLPFYADLCGRTLARAHARSGDAAAIAGYLGKSDSFDEAIAAFAMEYAKQSVKDWQALLDAIKDGRVKVEGT
jgi:uncharacterized protein (DUF2252 family)